MLTALLSVGHLGAPDVIRRAKGREQAFLLTPATQRQPKLFSAAATRARSPCSSAPSTAMRQEEP